MTWTIGTHGSTYGGNPVSCAAALATIDVIQQEHLMENADKVGDVMLNGLRDMAERHDSIREVRGLALMIGVEFADHDFAAEIEHRAFGEGLAGPGVRRRRGPHGAAARVPRGPGAHRARALRGGGRRRRERRLVGVRHDAVRRHARRSIATTRSCSPTSGARRSAIGWTRSTRRTPIVKPAAGPGWTMLFQSVPEDKAVKNRLHLDVRPSGVDGRRGRAAGAARRDRRSPGSTRAAASGP